MIMSQLMLIKCDVSYNILQGMDTSQQTFLFKDKYNYRNVHNVRQRVGRLCIVEQDLFSFSFLI